MLEGADVASSLKSRETKLRMEILFGANRKRLATLGAFYVPSTPSFVAGAACLRQEHRGRTSSKGMQTRLDITRCQPPSRTLSEETPLRGPFWLTFFSFSKPSGSPQPPLPIHPLRSLGGCKFDQQTRSQVAALK